VTQASPLAGPGAQFVRTVADGDGQASTVSSAFLVASAGGTAIVHLLAEDAMAQLATVAPPSILTRPRMPALPADAFRFSSLVLTDKESLARSRGLTALGSLALHGILVAIVLLVPLLSVEVPPAAEQVLRAFFVTPVELAPPPPPPPPPPAVARGSTPRAPAVVRPPTPGRFTAPIEIPDRVEPEPSLDFGVEGGVAGGVEGGVPGGVVGGIVGGLPLEKPAPPPPPLVRVGGKLVAPKRVFGPAPVYPELAALSGVTGLVVVDAHVGIDGQVKSVRFVSGNTLFEQAALEAVRQWRYQPLLLNGIPCEFMVVVNMNFHLSRQ
jgi:protein TonB